MNVKLYDTNALLELQEKAFEDYFVISSVTLLELENIKTSSNKSEEVKFKARNLGRLLVNNFEKYSVLQYCLAVEDLIYEAGLDAQSNDAKICGCGKYYQSDSIQFDFVTGDINCLLIGKNYFQLNTILLSKTDNEDLYKGYKKVRMTDEEMANFFSNPTENVYDLETNQYLIIENLEKNSTYKWDGCTHVLVTPSNFKSREFGVIKPKNVYQCCAMDSIENNMVTLLFGKSSSGKTLLPITYGMRAVEKGEYSSMTFIYSYDTLKGAKELGFEKGDHITKLLNTGAIGNILGTKFGNVCEVERLIEDGIINIVPTANIRGMSVKNSIVIVTEAQNLDAYTLKTIIQRCEDNCKLIIEGDMIEQVDTIHNANGMKKFMEVFKGNEDVGIMKLKGNFRSKIGELADKM